MYNNTQKALYKCIIHSFILSVGTHAHLSDLSVGAHALLSVSAHAHLSDLSVGAHAHLSDLSVGAHALLSDLSVCAHALLSDLSVGAHAHLSDGSLVHKLFLFIAVYPAPCWNKSPVFTPPLLYVVTNCDYHYVK